MENSTELRDDVSIPTLQIVQDMVQLYEMYEYLADSLLEEAESDEELEVHDDLVASNRLINLATARLFREHKIKGFFLAGLIATNALWMIREVVLWT